MNLPRLSCLHSVVNGLRPRSSKWPTLIGERTGRERPGRWVEPVCLDASALVKLVVPAAESNDLNRALAGLTSVIVSDMALTEMALALGRRRREQRLTRDEAQRFLS
jgi:hypothetical protein